MEPALQNEIAASPPIAVEAAAPWWQGITRYQWIVLLMTSLGLMFDLMDVSLLQLAMSPALRELLGAGSATKDVGFYGGLITTIFLIGWSLGGILFGIFADYYGRKNALMVTILLYSVFTGLAIFSHTWWEFAIYRFITALGIGGEWGAGTALLAETWPERARVKGGVILQSASSLGSLVAALINYTVGAYSWRYIFLVGALPGFMLLGLRWWVKESDRWLAAAGQSTAPSGAAARAGQKSSSHSAIQPARRHSRFTLSEILGKEHRRDTIVGATLATIVAFGFWAVGWFIPPMVSELLAQGGRSVSSVAVVHYVSNSRILTALGSLACYAIFLFMNTEWRRKTVLLVFFLGSFITTIMMLYIPHSLAGLFMLLPINGFFTLGSWVVFPIYLPELYPTRLRGTGAGFCFTVGRALSAIGPTMTGSLVRLTGSFVFAMTVPAFIYLLGPLVLVYARETRGQKLQ